MHPALQLVCDSVGADAAEAQVAVAARDVVAHERVDRADADGATGARPDYQVAELGFITSSSLCMQHLFDLRRLEETGQLRMELSRTASEQCVSELFIGEQLLHVRSCRGRAAETLRRATAEVLTKKHAAACRSLGKHAACDLLGTAEL